MRLRSGSVMESQLFSIWVTCSRIQSAPVAGRSAVAVSKTNEAEISVSPHIKALPAIYVSNIEGESVAKRKDALLSAFRMDPIFKFPASPGTPLFPVSPERANRQQLPQSPSLPSISHLQNDPFVSYSRGTSDVQGKVAQFNNLSKEAAQRRKDNEAALKRAVLGREEAENEARRLKEENRVLRLDVEEGRARERKVGERLEGMMVC